MSDLRDEYVAFFLSAPTNVEELECISLSHPNFSRTFNIVRTGSPAGITAALETGAVTHFEYYPLQVKQLASRADLDYGLSIDLGDLGDTVPDEIDRILSADTMTTPPKLVYRTYRSDDLTQPMFGPVELEVTAIAQNALGASFEATAPSMDDATTGEIYDFDTFPMLKYVS